MYKIMLTKITDCWHWNWVCQFTL